MEEVNKGGRPLKFETEKDFSETDDIVFKIINKYNLPIRSFYIDKDVHGEIK